MAGPCQAVRMQVRPRRPLRLDCAGQRSGRRRDLRARPSRRPFSIRMRAFAWGRFPAARLVEPDAWISVLAAVQDEEAETR